MKTRKILFILSAVSMTLYALWTIIWHMPFHMHLWCHTLWEHPLGIIYWFSYVWLLLGSILLASTAFLIKIENPQPPTKLHKYATVVFAIISLMALIAALFYSVCTCGSNYLYAQKVIRIIYTVLGSAWLWILAIRPCENQLSQAFRNLIKVGIGVIALLFALQLISGISFLTTGHCLMLNTCVLSSWIRYIVPTVLLCSYILLLFVSSKRPLLK